MKKKITHQAIQGFALKISVLKNELLLAGLIETYHEIDSVTKKIGWEIASIRAGNHPLVEIDSESE